ncbi:MAG: bacillithiol biosynthesis BshC [bacterium]|nr:bacillithiol biosynthesis BshC [bacterium]
MKNTFVTGQQLGLLGGPMYTAYKTLGAAHLAKKNNGNAVYWLESNDADFNEINHFFYINAEGTLKTLTWDIPTSGFSCGYIEVDDTLVDILEAFFNDIRQTEFTAPLKQMALECYAKGVTLEKASINLARHLYGFLDIRLFSPFETEFREFSQTILRNEAEKTQNGDQCNLFCLQDKQRKALFKKDDSFSLRDGTPVDLTTTLLVPNVKTRSVCQDAYFKTHTYVAGPGEINYLLEMDGQYEYHQVKQAQVERRMSLVLLEPAVKRILKKRGITLEEISAVPKETFVKKVLEKESGFDFKRTLGTANERTAAYLADLSELGFEPAEIKALRKNLLEQVKKISGQLRAKEKEKHNRLLKDASFLSDSLYPFGKKQERVFNLFHYMNLYGGTDFIRTLYENYDKERTSLDIG